MQHHQEGPFNKIVQDGFSAMWSCPFGKQRSVNEKHEPNLYQKGLYVMGFDSPYHKFGQPVSCISISALLSIGE